MSGIFISYRREDGATAARRLYDTLVGRFGAQRVFIDVETIEVGDEFGRVIEEKVGFCDALIAVIGPLWLAAGSPTGQRRLDDPDDWVRREIGAALRIGVKVFPVLVEGAALPRAEDLPRDLARLGEHQALALRADRFDRDLDRLLTALERLLRRGNAANLWLSILARGHRALDPLDLHRPETVWRALRFAMFMTLAGAVIRLPTLAFAGQRAWNPAFLITYLAANYIEWLAAAVIFHLAMRALGGRGTVAKSIAALCFLSGYLPVIGLAQMPVWGLHVTVLKDVADVAWSPMMAQAVLVQFTERLGVFGVVRVVLSFAVASALWLILAIAAFSALRSLHRFGRVRALVAFGLGLTAYLVFLAMFYGPLVGAAYRALERA